MTAAGRHPEQRSEPRRVITGAVGITGAAVFSVLVLVWIWAGFTTSWRRSSRSLLGALSASDGWWPMLLLVVSATAVFLAAGGRSTWRAGRTSIAAGVLLACGALIGFATFWPCSEGESPGWTALRRALGMVRGDLGTPFGPDGPCPGEPPLGLQAAQLMVTIGLLIVAGRAVGFLFANRVATFRAVRSRSFVLFDGAGRESDGFVRHVMDEHPGALAVLARPDGASPTRQVIPGLRIAAITLDLRDASAVRRFIGGRSTRAIRGVYLLGPDAVANLQAVEVLRRGIRRSPNRQTVPPRLIVRIDDPWHADDWRRRTMSRDDGWLHDAISVHEGAARRALALMAEQERSTVVLTGASPFELAVLGELSLRRRMTTATGAAAAVGPRVMLTGTDAGDAADHLRRQLRRFGILDEQPARAADQSLESLMDRSAVLLMAPGALGGDRPTFVAAAHPEWSILAWSPDAHGLSPVPLLAGMRPIGPTLDPAPGFGLDLWEWFARMAHERYVQTVLAGRSVPGDAARGRWEDLSVFTRESNLRAVATLARSIHQIGMRWATTLTTPSGDPLLGVGADQLEVLAEREHASWVRHHLEHGWRLAPARDDAARRHPSLVPWTELPEPEREKDRETVRSGLRLLDALGFALQPVDDPPTATSPIPSADADADAGAGAGAAA